MRTPILAKMRAMPSDKLLATKGARVEHILYGNEGDARRVAKQFSARGWPTDVDPRDEIGWGATLTEDAAKFRSQANERVRQLCSVAERNRMRYENWWITGTGMADYVSQDGDPLNVVEEVPAE